MVHSMDGHLGLEQKVPDKAIALSGTSILFSISISSVGRDALRA